MTRLRAWLARHLVGDLPEGCADLAISRLDRLDNVDGSNAFVYRVDPTTPSWKDIGYPIWPASTDDTKDPS